MMISDAEMKMFRHQQCSNLIAAGRSKVLPLKGKEGGLVAFH